MGAAWPFQIMGDGFEGVRQLLERVNLRVSGWMPEHRAWVEREITWMRVEYVERVPTEVDEF